MSEAEPMDYKTIFEDNRIGQRIYEDLIRRFGVMPSAGGTDGINRVLDQFEFSGRRRVIEFITARINQANGINDETTAEVKYERSSNNT